MEASNYNGIVAELEAAQEHLENAVEEANKKGLKTDESHAAKSLTQLTSGVIDSVESRQDNGAKEYEINEEVFLLCDFAEGE